MPAKDYNRITPRVVLSLAVILLIGPFQGTGAAPGKPAAETDIAVQVIQISADRLVSSTDAMVAEFSGNVRAVQEDTEIISDRLKIFYENKSETPEQAPMEKESIKKIVAEGNVKITFDNRVAVTERAVYTVKDRTLVLIGADSKITADNNHITGSRITINRDTGKITFERGTSGPVKAVIHAGENGLN